MCVADSLIPIFTLHAMERYAQRFPSHGHMFDEWKTAREASAAQLSMIRMHSVESAGMGKVANKSCNKHWVSKGGVVFVSAPSKTPDRAVVVTVFPMPTGHSKDGRLRFKKGKMSRLKSLRKKTKLGAAVDFAGEADDE